MKIKNTIRILLIVVLLFCIKNIVKAEDTTQIVETIVNVEYEYKPETNTVIATMTSNNELQNTKTTWKLSEDKKQYTFEFTTNTTYMSSVVDIYGNVIPVQIHITQIDDTPAKVQVSYKYKPETNTVIATMTSDKELQNTKTTWKLSEDKKQYTFEFTTNTTYMSSVVDRFGNVIPVQIHITQIDDIPAKVQVSYEYMPETNTVMATMTSDKELQNTKTTWKLSEDKKQYTFEFTTNTTYMSSVVDKYGNVIPVQIHITQIDDTPAKVEVSYEYKSETNTVIATMTSDKELQNTKTTWELSEDKKQYTFEFTTNTTYMSSVVDRFGNVIPVQINITQIDYTPAKVQVSYEYLPETNTVMATMTSDKELQNTKTTWKLSEDKKIYTFEFTTNTTYMSSVVDRFGNVIPVQIHITQIDDKGPEVTIKYEYNESKTKCIVTVTSNEEMIHKASPGWVLSGDKKVFTIEITSNSNYNTNFTDKYGNQTNMNINVFFSIVGIDVSAHNGKIDWEKVKKDEINFAIIRCGFGQNKESQDDKYFEYNISECERLNIPYGVYLYSYALDENSAISEAEHVLRLIEGHNPEYGIWLDMEDADGYKQENGMPSNETLINICITFVEKIKEKGYEDVGIYASLYWWNNQLNSTKLGKYDKWIAQWNDSCTYKKDFVMWQYTSQGRVDGINTNVDMNRYYRNK